MNVKEFFKKCYSDLSRVSNKDAYIVMAYSHFLFSIALLPCGQYLGALLSYLTSMTMLIFYIQSEFE